jgi:hypothetical protein
VATILINLFEKSEKIWRWETSYIMEREICCGFSLRGGFFLWPKVTNKNSIAEGPYVGTCNYQEERCHKGSIGFYKKGRQV